MSRNHPVEPDIQSDGNLVDQSVLFGLLNIGDEGMRRDLCAQLLADFRRMAIGLDDAEPVTVARVAHELKGLSATIGAQRLADMAQTLHHSAENVSPSALAVLAFPVRREIAGILEILGTFMQRFERQ